MSDPRSRLPRSLTAIGILLAMALVVAACSGAGTAATSTPAVSTAPAASPSTEPAASSPTASSAGAVCGDVAALKDAITALSKVDLQAGGAAALTAAVDDVKTAAEALKSSASSELSATVGTFTTQVDALKTAVSQLGQDGAGGGLIAVGTAIAGLASSAQALETQFETACP